MDKTYRALAPLRADLELLLDWNGETRDRDGDGSYDGPQPTIMRTWLPILFERFGESAGEAANA